jgi:hypothetical protein
MNDRKDHYLKLANNALDQMPFIDREKVKVLLPKDNNLLWRVINTGLWISKFNVTA